MSFRYILRYFIDPGFFPEDRIAEIVRFCVDSRIEEIMLFLAAEELSAGHPTEDEISAFIELAQKLKSALVKEGVEISLNPWSTIYHSARGRGLRSGQDFRLMVGENGTESRISPCPLCENWQYYLGSTFARLAREITPVALWIEDDWRLRNHDSALGWGGCFCAEHLRLFSEKVGEHVTRETLLSVILAPGEPHPWRDIWLDLSCETLLRPLARVSEMIRIASPSTRVALMSGSPDLHAAEGRDWPAFQQAVAGDGIFISRPTMKPYTQAHALGTPPGLTRLAIAHFSGPAEIYPELENSPRCGAYSKSRAYSIWQMQHAAVMGSSGITINHYDMLGNGISLDAEFGRDLARAKPLLNALSELGADDRNAHGAKVLFHPRIARHIQTKSARAGLGGLSQGSTTWGDACSILGIAHAYTETPTAEPVLVCQQTLRAFSDEEVRHFLSGAVILDAESVAILLQRGFGAEIGIQACTMETLAQTAYSYERIDARRFWVSSGPETPRLTAQRCSPWLARLTTNPETEILTTICTADHQPLWPGATLFHNRLGGHAVCLAYPVNAGGQFFMGFFNVYRCHFLQKLLMEIAPASAQAAVENAPMHVYRTPTEHGTLLAAINPTDDSISEVRWLIPSGDFNEGSWTVLTRDGSWIPIAPVHKHEALIFSTDVAPLQGAFFHHQNQ